MKLVTFRTKAEQDWGFAHEGKIYNFSSLYANLRGAGKVAEVPEGELPECVGCLLDAGEAGWRSVQAVWEALVAEGGIREALVGREEEVELLPPNPAARKLFCLAGNYVEHLIEGGGRLAEQDRQTPRVFMKPASTTLRGARSPIIISRYAQKIDWEAELAVIIGKKGKYISGEEAEEYIAGYSVFNDVSERAFKIWERTESGERDRFFDWLNGKWLDGFAPMGPYLVSKDEVPDVQNLHLSLKVNDELMQDANTSQMIFKVNEVIEFISSFVTLEPGDIIATGTPAGVGSAREIFLKAGDVVMTEIERLGRMVNPVQAE